MMKSPNTALLFSLFLFVSGLGFAQTVDTNFVDGRIYVKVKASSNVDLANYTNFDPTLNNLISAHQVTSMPKAFQTQGAAISKVFRVEYSNYAGVDDLITGFSSLQFIEYAEKAPLYYLSFTPNDLNTSQQYALDVIQAEEAWEINKGSADVVVAIVDNGVNINHEDIQPNRWLNTGEIANNGIDDDLNGYTDDLYGWDAADSDNDPTPPAGGPGPFVHGSHCAGIASAKTNNGVGIASIGYNVSIMGVKATRDNSDGKTLSAAYEGVDYAISAGANVISMSFGSSGGFLTWDILINQAQSRGIFMVAAAGNDDSDSEFYPAAYPYVFSVGATDPNDNKASFSNYGSTIDVMAPGLNIYSTYFQTNSTYGNLSGTSMSTPLVAGLAGLLLSYDSSISVADLKAFLRDGCDNIDAQNPTYINDIGSGRINAFKSLQLAAGLTLEEIDTDNFNFVLYPNPSSDFVNFKPNQALPKPSTITLYDMQGKIALEQEVGIVFAGGKQKVDVKNLKQGLYFFRFQLDDFVETRKIIIQ